MDQNIAVTVAFSVSKWGLLTLAIRCCFVIPSMHGWFFSLMHQSCWCWEPPTIDLDLQGMKWLTKECSDSPFLPISFSLSFLSFFSSFLPSPSLLFPLFLIFPWKYYGLGEHMSSPIWESFSRNVCKVWKQNTEVFVFCFFFIGHRFDFLILKAHF